MASKLKPGDPAPALSGKAVNMDDTVDIKQLMEKGPVVVVFSRYFGCPVCQSDFDKLIDVQDELLDRARLVYVIQSSPERATAFLASRDEKFPVLCDPDPPYPLYGAWGIKNVSLVTLGKMAKVVLSRKYQHGEYEGNEKQSPADFIVGKDGTITRVNYSLLDTRKIIDSLGQ